jgi:two-component system sensor histidine kinase UhpB
VARHAETEQAWVRVESGDDHSIRIRVHDHGRGMGSAPEGLGRRGIRERAELTGAKLRWFEPEGGGTGLEVNVARHRRIRKGRDANSTG